jgi:hypothetical protein
MRLFVLLLVVLLHCVACAKYVYDSNMPPRLQWLANDGYCGEVSTISAGLKYGQYLSQYDMRDLATSGDQLDEYLVGVNDETAAKKVSLNHLEFDGQTNVGSENYLSWIKTMMRKGYATTIAVYMNYYLFYGITTADAGDAEYDHIVSVYSITSNYDDDIYHDDDVITISDHGLWAPRVTGPVFYFNYTFKEFIGTRQDANKKNGNTYTLPQSSRSTTLNYGIAHTGPYDDSGVVMPLKVVTDKNIEKPEMVNRSEKRPDPMDLALTVTVSGLESGVQYVLYRYSDESKVPSSTFNKLASNAAEVIKFTASKSTYSVTKDILSSDKVFYRCVRADAN